MSNKYRNNFMITDDEIELEREGVLTLPDDAPPEEKSYAKRYADLRRHQQAEAVKFNSRIKELEDKLTSVASNQMDLPTSEEDIEAWVKKYPDVAKIVTGIARQQASAVTADLDARVKQIDDRELEVKKKEAQAKLEEKHPDFFTTIRQDPAFHEWLEEQTDDDRAALYDNDVDWKAASRVISDYKYEKGIVLGAKKEPKRDTRREDAGAVNVRGGGPVPAAQQGYKYTESQIAKMHPKEYDRLEADIEAAHRAGKVFFDISGGAR